MGSESIAHEAEGQLVGLLSVLRSDWLSYY